ncbi:hypothetical protein OS42_34770 [Dickeya oryzae]
MDKHSATLTTTSTPVLAVNDYSLDYALPDGSHLPVLRDITLHVNRGDVVGLVGGIRLRQKHHRVIGVAPVTVAACGLPSGRYSVCWRIIATRQ